MPRVLAGLEVLTSLAKEHNGKPPCTVRLVDWADEEGARFGRSLFGSSAFAGSHTIEADRKRTDRDGTTLEAALQNCGIDVVRIGDASREQKNIAAYLELHIEQGPILENLGNLSAVVQGTKGVERWAITFHGQEAHSGSTPMEVRRDALAAAAKLALEIRPIARKHPQSVATMGSVKTFPGIVTAVVGRCETTLDMRDLDADVLARNAAREQGSQRAFRERRALLRRVVEDLVHRADPLPPRTDQTLPKRPSSKQPAVSEQLPSGPCTTRLKSRGSASLP